MGAYISSKRSQEKLEKLSQSATESLMPSQSWVQRIPLSNPLFLEPFRTRVQSTYIAQCRVYILGLNIMIWGSIPYSLQQHLGPSQNM